MSQKASAKPANAGIPSKKVSLPPLLTWQNPSRTGTVFAELLGSLIVLRYGNLLRVALRLTYWTVALTGLVEYASRHLSGKKQGIVSTYRPSRYIDIRQASLEKFTSKASHFVVDSLTDIKRLFDAEDLPLSLSVFVVSFLGYILLGFVSISSLLILSVILLFTLPRVYLQFQTQIDEIAAKIHKEASTHLDTANKHVNKTIGPHLDVAKKHASNVFSLVGLNRGGFPSDESKSVRTTATDVPSTGTAKSTSADVPSSHGISKTSASSDVHDASKPVNSVAADAAKKAASEAPAVGKNTDNTLDPALLADISKYDTVPTLIGDVNLNKDLPAEALKTAHGKFDEGKTNLGDTLKQHIDENKKNLAI